MFKYLFILLLTVPFFADAQQLQSLDTIKAPASYDNIFVKAVAFDSLSSSFVIFIKKEVKKHKHLFHTEQVYVLEGEGDLLLGDKKFHIKKGDIIFIPKNTPHALTVTSAVPVKILSVQSPFFDGTDKILVD